ncbi:MAG: hypothetical protein MUP76_00655 [Acidimicrobiia bacterium]|nr:hypothetical protein [Acidimicrobiia bacterium]
MPFAWLVLLAAQAALLAVGLKLGRRTHPRSIAVLALLAGLSPAAIAIFFWYAGRYV